MISIVSKLFTNKQYVGCSTGLLKSHTKNRQNNVLEIVKLKEDHIRVDVKTVQLSVARSSKR